MYGYVIEYLKGKTFIYKKKKPNMTFISYYLYTEVEKFDIRRCLFNRFKFENKIFKLRSICSKKKLNVLICLKILIFTNIYLYL